MPDFLIRNLDEDTMRRLKERAAAGGRSLQAEVKETLRRSLKMTRDETLATIDRFLDETRELGLSDSVEMIREDRESR